MKAIAFGGVATGGTLIAAVPGYSIQVVAMSVSLTVAGLLSLVGGAVTHLGPMQLAAGQPVTLPQLVTEKTGYFRLPQNTALTATITGGGNVGGIIIYNLIPNGG